jgi:hypothetical protein
MADTGPRFPALNALMQRSPRRVLYEKGHLTLKGFCMVYQCVYAPGSYVFRIVGCEKPTPRPFYSDQASARTAVAQALRQEIAELQKKLTAARAQLADIDTLYADRPTLEQEFVGYKETFQEELRKALQDDVRRKGEPVEFFIGSLHVRVGPESSNYFARITIKVSADTPVIHPISKGFCDQVGEVLANMGIYRVEPELEDHLDTLAWAFYTKSIYMSGSES